MSILLAAVLQASPAIPDTRVTVVSRHGAFVLEREDYKLTGFPIMHSPSEWRKARLIWSSEDGGVRAIYEDSGRFLEFGYQIRRKAGQPVACYVGRTYAAFGNYPGTGKKWLAGMRGLQKALTGCGGLDESKIDAYQK